MNEQWAKQQLQLWVTTASKARMIWEQYGGGHEVKPFAGKDGELMDALRGREDQVAQIIQKVLGLSKQPELLVRLDGDYVEVQAGIDSSRRAIGVLDTRAETEANLGSSAPTMKAALHPLIWGAASKRWESEHYSDAVQRAATALSGLVKDQTGRYELGDSELVSQAFSLSPPQQGKPRLRWPGNDDDLNVKTMRVGILNMAQGVFAAIRNPASHTIEEVPRQEALEQLATLSILARWIERCELVDA